MRAAVLLPTLLLQGCAFLGIVGSVVDKEARCEAKYRREEMANVHPVSFVVRADERTPGGLHVDTSNRKIPPGWKAGLDAQVARWEACSGHRLCRDGVKFKVAPAEEVCQYRLNGSIQEGNVFRCDRPRHPNDACPGTCAGSVDFPATIIVTLDHPAVPHELEHLEHRTDLHDHPHFPQCGDDPQVIGLANGVQNPVAWSHAGRGAGHLLTSAGEQGREVSALSGADVPDFVRLLGDGEAARSARRALQR